MITLTSYDCVLRVCLLLQKCLFPLTECLAQLHPIRRMKNIFFTVHSISVVPFASRLPYRLFFCLNLGFTVLS